MSDDRSTWRVRRIRGNPGLPAQLWAIMPGCPEHGHAIRECRCRVFKKLSDVESYVATQKALDAPADAS